MALLIRMKTNLLGDLLFKKDPPLPPNDPAAGFWPVYSGVV